ncbi:hypothetical protein BXT84_04760 [Sulfobacillus thermotolerans]|uniref:Lipoprotein n=1 Tax=Sulfobacillus thermotolerans TaxID=338644 RepID=A0ABN5GYD0_9FIRM|nr:hypothetical protein BXT84_04760 [Sulfobacillus thermotolerans]
MGTLAACAQEPLRLERGYVYWNMSVKTCEGTPVIAVDIIGRMPARLFMRLKNRGQCPKTYAEVFVAHALQYDADATEYQVLRDTGRYLVTIPDSLRTLQKVFETFKMLAATRA